MAPEALFSETRLLFSALKHWAESVHAGLDLSAPMRAVLELLLLAGPATVPAMARSRGASRQHIQQQVDALLDRGLVRREDNPAHRRSHKITLTDRGAALIKSVRADELNAVARIQAGVSDSRTAEAARVLSAWRSALERDERRRAQRELAPA